MLGYPTFPAKFLNVCIISKVGLCRDKIPTRDLWNGLGVAGGTGIFYLLKGDLQACAHLYCCLAAKVEHEPSTHHTRGKTHPKFTGKVGNVRVLAEEMRKVLFAY